MVAVVAGAMFLPGTLFRGYTQFYKGELKCITEPATQEKGKSVTWKAEFKADPTGQYNEISGNNIFWWGYVGDNGTLVPNDDNILTDTRAGKSSFDVTYPQNYSKKTATANVRWNGPKQMDYFEATCSVNLTEPITQHVKEPIIIDTYFLDPDPNLIQPILIEPILLEPDILTEQSPEVLNVSCSASPNPVKVGEEVTWTASVSGGTPPYKIVWSDPTDTKIDKKNTATVKTSYSVAVDEHKVALLVADETGILKKTSCSVKVEALPTIIPLTATCSVNPSSIKAGDTVTWTADATGGDGTYSYLWVGDKIDGKTTKSVQATFTQKPLTDNFRVIVTSGGENRTLTCPALTFTPTTTPVVPPAEEKKPGEPSKCPGVDYPNDVKGHWAETHIKKGYDYCLFRGVDGKFFPDRNATRIEAASMILYAKDKRPSAACTTLACLKPFSDLQNAEQGAILNPLYFEDLIQGYPNNQFRPASLITRAEAASLIVKAFFEPYGPACYDPHCGAGWPDNFFLDITDTWQGKFIRVLWDLRIMTGTGPNRVEPNRSITRAEMAKMIVLAYEEQPNRE